MQTIADPIEVAEMIVASISVPVVVVDASLRARMANPALCRLVRMPASSVSGMSIDKLIVDAPHLRTALNRMFVDGVDMEKTEILCTTGLNKHRVLAVSGRRLPSSSTDPILVMLELRDVTREHAAIREIDEVNRAVRRHSHELEELNHALDTFNFSIAHDLRTPLRLMNRVAHTLLENHGAGLTADVIDLVNSIVTSTDEMGKLTGDLLRFSQANRESIKRKPVKMRQLVRESIVELYEERQGRDVRMVVDELPSCYGNRALLKQLILNLLGNALKFTRECEWAEIRIGCTQTQRGDAYYVRDNGIGFDMSDAESMFLVFQRLHRSRGFEGTGVGLAIAKRIVERHGGRIWAEPGPDRGATFYFTIEAPSPQSNERM